MSERAEAGIPPSSKRGSRPGGVDPKSGPMADELDGLLAEYDTWLRIERGLAPNSLAAYRRDLRRYAEYLRRRGVTGDVALVDESIVSGWVEELQQARTDDGMRRYKESSIARALAAVRS